MSMNERVTEIYTQMFAPQPIPQSVKEMYERTVFFANRIDATMFKPTELAIIAGAATQGKMEVQKAAAVAANEPVDTSEPSPPTVPPPTAPAPAPETPVDGQTPEPEPKTPGIMDARHKPDRKRRGLAATKMLKLTVKELRVHAKENYGWTPPTQYKKPEIIAVLQHKEPLGT